MDTDRIWKAKGRTDEKQSKIWRIHCLAGKYFHRKYQWIESEVVKRYCYWKVLFVNGKLLAIVEAKKYGVGAQNVLEQAKRYAKGVVHNVGRWGEYMVPFLFSSSGEQVFFIDVRFPQNISRSLQDFYSPDALWEFFNRDDVYAFNWLVFVFHILLPALALRVRF